MPPTGADSYKERRCCVWFEQDLPRRAVRLAGVPKAALPPRSQGTRDRFQPQIALFFPVTRAFDNVHQNSAACLVLQYSPSCYDRSTLSLPAKSVPNAWAPARLGRVSGTATRFLFGYQPSWGEPAASASGRAAAAAPCGGASASFPSIPPA